MTWGADLSTGKVWRWQSVFLCCVCAAFGMQMSPEEAKLREAVRLSARSFEANAAMGRYLLRSGRPKESVRFLEAAREALPTHAGNTADLASAYLESGATGKVKPLIDELKSAGHPVFHLEGRWLNATGDFRGAALAFQQAAEADPSEENLFTLANHLLAHNGSQDARKVLSWSIERYPRSARLRVAQGVTAYTLSQYDDAVRILCEAVDLDPSDPRPLTFLGQMIGVSKTLQPELGARLAGLAKRYPGNSQAQYLYAMALLGRENPGVEEAEALLKKAATLDPRDPRPYLELGKIYADRQRIDEAVKSLEAALRRDPSLESAHYRLGQIHQLRRRPDLAAPHFAAYRKLKAAREESSTKH